MKTPVQTTLALPAMGTRFEVALWGLDRYRMRAAAQEALNEIERLEGQLSIYRPDSDISDINARAAFEAVPVEPRLFRLLQTAHRLYEETEGAFDITVAPLMECWRAAVRKGSIPSDEVIEEARGRVGMELVELDSGKSTIRYAREGMMLDLGAIGKGYAIDCAIGLLQMNGFSDLLLHGGASSIFALGSPPDAEGWQVAIQNPGAESGETHLAVITLRDSSLSVSAPHGRWFMPEEQRYGHVLDPRSGRPTDGAVLAAFIGPSATEGDALSTAMLVLGESGMAPLLQVRPACGALVCTRVGGSGLHIAATGIPKPGNTLPDDFV